MKEENCFKHGQNVVLAVQTGIKKNISFENRLVVLLLSILTRLGLPDKVDNETQKQTKQTSFKDGFICTGGELSVTAHGIQGGPQMFI